MYNTIIEMPFYSACWRFADFVIKRNTEDLNRELIIEPLDAVNEVYARQANNISQAKKIIYSFIMAEIRRAYTKHDLDFNTNNIEIIHEKQCKKCLRVLPENEFYFRLDYVTGFPSRTTKCKACIVDEKTTEEARRKKRERENNQNYKEKARERYLRWKAKHCN